VCILHVLLFIYLIIVKVRLLSVRLAIDNLTLTWTKGYSVFGIENWLLVPILAITISSIFCICSISYCCLRMTYCYASYCSTYVWMSCYCSSYYAPCACKPTIVMTLQTDNCTFFKFDISRDIVSISVRHFYIFKHLQEI
jgi:hypothetical protein